MKLPKPVKPVFRTSIGLIETTRGLPAQPDKVANIAQASRDQQIELITGLIHGANYNAPMRFLAPVDSCGCHILSGSSMATCLAACGLL